MSISDRKLGNIANNMFRDSHTVPGGTAGALRNEALSGERTQGKFHLAPAQQYAQAIRNWIGNNPTASANNMQAAKTLLTDLEDAISGAEGNVPTLHALFEQGLHNETPNEP
jgi:hypothetical protein